MIELLSEMFSYAFLVRAFLVGALVSVCASALGVSLVLKRYSMIGDGLSHVGFGTLAIATAFNAAPLSIALPVVLAAAFLLLRISESSKIKSDAAIAIISSASLAIGVVIISQTTGMNTDVCNYLFGSILAMTKTDVYLSIVLSLVVLVLFVLFYNKLFAITFDETFARATGVRTGIYNMMIAFLCAITIVLGMRLMGAMLISSLIIFPALTSMRIFKTFKSVTIVAAVVSALCFFSGITLSFVYATPTGASIVLMNIVAFLLFWGISSMWKMNKSENKNKNVMRNASRITPSAVSNTLLLVFVPVIFLSVSCSKEASIADAPYLEGDALQQSQFGQDEIERPKMFVQKNGVVEIKDRLFIAQTNDMFLNPDDYFGKTVKVAGIFKLGGYEDPHYFVIRYGPGCCGYDGTAGFEVKWDSAGKYPEQDAWVEALGEFKSYEEDGYPYYYISLSQLDTKQERGLEYVTQ
ncbi:MAG: hypothetical protein Ta2A_05060 [Treponemataceae bacterium]|nr:MAG: hypothetical protein Ta2A_05060 [Treponemataceae bacterium]